MSKQHEQQLPTCLYSLCLLTISGHGNVHAGVTLAIALSCTGVALFVGACVAGSTAFTVAIG